MTQALRGAELTARARDFERRAGVAHTEVGGLISLLCNELDSTRRFLAHLAGEAIGARCELTGLSGISKGGNLGRCTGDAVAIRWEDGFADSVCEEHAQLARERGTLVIEPRRHNGETHPE